MRRRIEEITRAFVRGLTGAPSKRPPSPLPEQLASLLVFGRPTSFLRRPMMRCMAVGPVLLPATRTRLVPFVPRAARYGFGEVRVARLALLIFTAMSGSHSCGVVITKFSDHVVTFRSSPTVFADTPVPTSASTCILAGKLGENYVERSNAFALVPGHRLLPDCSAAEQLTIEGTSFARHASERGHGTLEGVSDNKFDEVPNALGWRLGRSNSVILPKAGKPENPEKCEFIATHGSPG